MQLNRKKIQRMFDGLGTSTGSGGGSGGADITAWVNENFVSKAYFSQLFKAFKPGENTGDPDIEVEPNSIDEDISNIQAMVGFWTEEYISALGRGSGGGGGGGGGGGSTTLQGLLDVNIPASMGQANDGQVLMYNYTQNKWINANLPLASYATETWVAGHFLGINDTAAAATKLATARTLWGQSFDGSANVTGTITVGAGNIIMNNNRYIYFKDVPAEGASATNRDAMRLSSSNNLLIGYGVAGAGYNSYLYGNNVRLYYGTSRTAGLTLNNSGNVGIGTTSPTVKLDVNGYAKTTRLYLSSSVYLEYDSTNLGVHLVGAGFWSDSFVSALGLGTGGGGGGDFIPLSGSANITGSLTPATNNTYDLGTSTKAWGTIYCNAISGNASLAVQNISCVTLSTSARAVISSGAKFASICVESNSNGELASSRAGEINRYSSATLHLQKDTGTGGVTMCKQKFQFSENQGVSTIALGGNMLYLNAGSSAPQTSIAWTTSSDIRKKDVVCHVEVDLKAIAAAPIFNYRLKSDVTGEVFLGTKAQYWCDILPFAVKKDVDGFFSMDYAATALAAAVMTARKVMTHEEEITILKKRIEYLENRLNIS